MRDRQLVASASPWEPRFGFSRAVRAGPLIFVAGTIATDPDGLPLAEDAHGQASAIIRRIAEALEAAGSGLEDVVRTRMYLCDLEDAEEVGRAHREAFGDILPAATMVEVSRLVGTGFRVEIEADAVIGRLLPAGGL